MCDINLNDPSKISNELSKLPSNESIADDDQEGILEEEASPKFKGSLFDNLTQNNPYAPMIKENFQLELNDLMLSKDFHFKT